MTASRKDPADRLSNAYDGMLERVHRAIEETGKSAASLQHTLAQAKEKAVELGELTREEADRIASYIERDMHDAADFISESGRELSDWLQFDLQFIENRFLEMFANVADRTRVELAELAQRAREASTYHTGEITGPGTLVCRNCGKPMHFHRTGHIPPCAACKGTVFKRSATDS